MGLGVEVKVGMRANNLLYNVVAAHCYMINSKIVVGSRKLTICYINAGVHMANV